MSPPPSISRRGLLATLGGGASLGAAGLLDTDVVLPDIKLDARQPAGEWPMAKREPQRTGYQPQSGPRTGLTERWRGRAGGADIPNPGLVATSGRVHTTGRYVIRTFSGRTGSLDWERRHRDRFLSAFPGESPFEFVHAGPAVNGDRLYTVAAVTLYEHSVSTGESGWAFRTNSSFERILPVGNVVFAGVLVDDDYRLVALDGSTGLRQWTQVSTEVPLAFASATDFREDTTLLLTGAGAGGAFSRLVARDPTDGTVLWRTRRDDQAFDGLTTPAISWGRVYAGGRPLTAFDTADGSVVWRTRPDGIASSVSPVTDGERVYVAGGDVAAALDSETGTPLWTTEVGETSVYVPPVVAGETLYVAVRSTVVGLDVRDGSERFRHSVSDTDGLVSGMISADGILYVRVGGSLRAYVGPEGDADE